MSHCLNSHLSMPKCYTNSGCAKSQKVSSCDFWNQVNRATIRGTLGSPKSNDGILAGTRESRRVGSRFYSSQQVTESSLNLSGASKEGHFSAKLSRSSMLAAQSPDFHFKLHLSPGSLGRRENGGVIKQLSLSKGGPVCLFGGLFGGKKEQDLDTVATKRSFYHVGEPPFPNRLLDGTHLAGRDLRCCYRASVDGFGKLSLVFCDGAFIVLERLKIAPVPSKPHPFLFGERSNGPSFKHLSRTRSELWVSFLVLLEHL